MFGIDIIVEKGTGHHVVIDINYFPGKFNNMFLSQACKYHFFHYLCALNKCSNNFGKNNDAKNRGCPEVCLSKSRDLIRDLYITSSYSKKTTLTLTI